MAMANGQQVSIRENSVKSGGIVSVTPNSNISDISMIDTIVAKQQAQILMERTLINTSEYGATELIPGQPKNIKHLNVGLGMGTWLTVTAHLEFTNTTAATLTPHPEFPFNIIKRFETEFNGNNKLHSLTGYQIWELMCRRGKGNHGITEFANPRYGASVSLVPSSSIAGYTNVTQASAFTVPQTLGEYFNNTPLNGVSTLTVSNTQPVDFYVNFYVPFTWREDIPIGMVPLQNNNIHGQMIIQCNDIVTANMAALTDLYTTCFGTTDSCELDMSGSYITVEPMLEYMSIPNPMILDNGDILSSEALYSYFTNTSYLAINIDYTTASNGPGAFNFSIPNNYLLAAITATMKQNGQELNVWKNTDNWGLMVNNSLQLYKMKNRRRMLVNGVNGLIPVYGSMVFDMTRGVDENPNNLNTTKWLNLYDVNNPTWVADIDPTIQGAVDWNILLESLVPGNIALV